MVSSAFHAYEGPFNEIAVRKEHAGAAGGNADRECARQRLTDDARDIV